MRLPENNYAFIDGQNLHLSMREMGWVLDESRFLIHLSEKYGVAKAYYFLGYMKSNEALYNRLEASGYNLIYKRVLMIGGKPKGNCDSNLVMQAMVDIDEYDKAVIVTSDGDMACLVEHLRQKGKLKCVLAPRRGGCSCLLTQAAGQDMAFMDGLRNRLEYRKKSTL